jgi:hypothetical protein
MPSSQLLQFEFELKGPLITARLLRHDRVSALQFRRKCDLDTQDRYASLPNGPLAKLQAGSHANGYAARQLPRQTLVRRERTATDVTPSQTLVQALQRRASESPVCQLQLIVSPRH